MLGTCVQVGRFGAAFAAAPRDPLEYLVLPETGAAPEHRTRRAGTEGLLGLFVLNVDFVDRIPIDPGPHEMVVRVGTAEKRAAFEAVAGETKTLDLGAPDRQCQRAAQPVASATTSPPTDDVSMGPSTQSTVGWLFVAGSGAGLVLFGVTGGLIVAADGTAGDNCPAKCNADGQSAVDRGDALLLPNAIGLVAGTVLAGVGITLLITDPGEPAASAASLQIGSGGVSAAGRF